MYNLASASGHAVDWQILDGFESLIPNPYSESIISILEERAGGLFQFGTICTRKFYRI